MIGVRKGYDTVDIEAFEKILHTLDTYGSRFGDNADPPE